MHFLWIGVFLPAAQVNESCFLSVCPPVCLRQLSTAHWGPSQRTLRSVLRTGKCFPGAEISLPGNLKTSREVAIHFPDFEFCLNWLFCPQECFLSARNFISQEPGAFREVAFHFPVFEFAKIGLPCFQNVSWVLGISLPRSLISSREAPSHFPDFEFC